MIAINQAPAGRVGSTAAQALNWISWLAFLAEATLMLAVVDDRARWLRRHPLEVAIVC